MSELFQTVADWFEQPMARSSLRAAFIIIVGIAVARLARRRIAGGLAAPERRLASRLVGGLILGLAFSWALSELGLRISVVLGAAGVLTIAVGFAAQTAVSNLISGLFLLVERPFRTDDVIEIGGTTGEVVAIDIMSTKLRTFDNLLVRIPNEVMIKAEVKNHTHFPIRRIDVELRVEHGNDLGRLNDVFLEVAAAIPQCLDEPRPALHYQGFDDAGVRIKLAVWSASSDFFAAKNEFQQRLTESLRAAEIELGFPRRKIVGG